MALTDDELLAFDGNRLSTYDEGGARERLAGEHGDLYRNHLVIARWIEGWRERMSEDMSPPYNDGRDQGVEYALREVTAHLRQGDFLPGEGSFYDEETQHRL